MCGALRGASLTLSLVSQLFAASFWELSAEVVEALCDFTVCLVR